jgi:hypothetical protein
MVDVLTAVLTDGLPAVEAACAEAITHGVHSADGVLNVLMLRVGEFAAAPTDLVGPVPARCIGWTLRQIRGRS